MSRKLVISIELDLETGDAPPSTAELCVWLESKGACVEEIHKREFDDSPPAKRVGLNEDITPLLQSFHPNQRDELALWCERHDVHTPQAAIDTLREVLNGAWGETTALDGLGYASRTHFVSKLNWAYSANLPARSEDLMPADLLSLLTEVREQNGSSQALENRLLRLLDRMNIRSKAGLIAVVQRRPSVRNLGSGTWAILEEMLGLRSPA